eukprot:scaffold131882_cov66-Attheya_sp.AAC.1
MNSDDLTTAEPSRTNCEQEGRDLMKANLRSIVMSELAFRTYTEFAKQDPTTTTGSASALRDLPDATTAAIEGLVEQIGDVSVSETEHTKEFCRVVKASACNSNLTPHDQWNFRVPRPKRTTSSDTYMSPRSDVVFVQNIDSGVGDEGTRRNPVALLEVGKAKKKDKDSIASFWLEKFGQGVKYVNLMRNDSVVGQKRSREDESSSDDSYTESNMSATAPEKISSQKFGKLWMEDPMLFYTIVYGSERRVVEEEDTSGDDADGEELSMMIGCFFAEKRPVRDRSNSQHVRLALMYRKHEKGKADIAAALGSMLKQIYWFKDYRQNEHGKKWQYLGPHCALVTTSATETDEVETKEVYRSYDSRPWPISRSSAVYRNEDLHDDTYAVVDSVRDEGWSTTRTQTPYRIFDFCGELDIIAIPFIEGSHIPEMIDQLIEVARHLKRFHDYGFVHGDLRLLNM